jgi:hypothetical protein
MKDMLPAPDQDKVVALPSPFDGSVNMLTETRCTASKRENGKQKTHSNINGLWGAKKVQEHADPIAAVQQSLFVSTSTAFDPWRLPCRVRAVHP